MTGVILDKTSRTKIISGTEINNVNGDDITICIDCRSVIKLCNCEWRTFIPKQTRKLFGIENPKQKCLCTNDASCIGHIGIAQNVWWQYHIKQNQKNFEVITIK